MERFRPYTKAEVHMRNLMTLLADAVEQVKDERKRSNEDISIGSAFIDMEREIYVGIQFSLTDEQKELMRLDS